MEAKELLTFLGIEADTLDDFKTKFSDKYAGDEKQAATKWLGSMVGEKTGKIKQNILKKAREEGIEFTQNEFDKMEIEEIHSTLTERKLSKLKADYDALKSKPNTDEALRDLQEKFEKASKRANEEEKLRKDLSGEFDKYKSESINQVKAVKIDYLKKDEMSKLKLKAGLSDLEKAGFESHIEKNFRFDFDDKGNPFPTDVDGNRIRSSKKADEYKSIGEVLSETAAAFKILAENPQAGKPAPPPFTPPTQQGSGSPPPPQQTTGRKVNPMFDNY